MIEAKQRAVAAQGAISYALEKETLSLKAQGVLERAWLNMEYVIATIEACDAALTKEADGYTD